MPKMNENSIAIDVAADKLGMGVNSLKDWIRSETCPFAIYRKKKDGNKKGQFYIFSGRFYAYVNGDDIKSR